ncbi:Calx-beta domain-containing protein [Phenylobacterium sp.]|uniref:Calx-beta domain-containing protein n=1 Tax=Phenylobacterium sp. TaxID=1871053 RepID=UPI002F3E5824
MAIDPNNLAGTASLTFSDEFNNLSLWNGSAGTWYTNYYFGADIATFPSNGELQWYINDNTANTSSVNPWTVSSGVLSLTAAKTDPAIKPYINNYDYTSGVLTTQFSYSQTYGYFEISAKLPKGDGLWPAFWLLPSQAGAWRPEIDVMEVLGKDPTSLWQFSHPADTSYDRSFNTKVPDMSAGFHRYGVDWEADKITYYFDGQVTGVAPTAPEMNSPMYMILNLAVGGSWGGPPTASTVFPANYQIDYIRAYQASTGPTFTNLAISGPQSLSEGASGPQPFTYTVTRTGSLAAATTVSWAVTGSGAAPANAADFTGGTLPGGALNFAANQATATITVNVNGDAVVEPDEGFTVTLSNATGGTITAATATGTVLNDDSQAGTTLTVGPATITQPEGASGDTYFVFTVQRSGSLAGPSVATFAVAGSGANPASASDFSGGAFPSGKVFFGGGEASKTIWIPVAGDTAAEPNESFTVTLSNPSGATITGATAQGVIQNDDAAPGATLALGPATVSHLEGDSGSTAFLYTVTRSGDLSGAGSAAWAVSGSGANPANAADFAGGVLPSGVVNFAAGQSSATVTVNAAGDAAVETDESFTVTLSNPSGATITGATAQGVIQNDDAAPSGTSLSIGPQSLQAMEGTGSDTYFVFDVARSGDVGGPSTVDWVVTGSGAHPVDASDLVGGLPGGTSYFGGGETQKSIWILVHGDAVNEPDETFTLTLHNATGASVVVGSALGTILNDDGVTVP